MQNLSRGYVPKDLPHCREVGVPCPWKHSRPGWMGLWAPGSSWRCAGWLQKCWTFQVSSNPNRSGMVLPSQIVATLDGLFAATTPVPSALQLNEIKTSFDMFKQWLYCRLTVFLHHIWGSRLGDFKYNSLANCAFGNWVLMHFSVSVYVESYLFSAKECQLYISLLFHFLNYWMVSVYILTLFLQFFLHQWTPRKPPQNTKNPKLSTHVWMSSCQGFKWVKQCVQISMNLKKQCENKT